MTPIPRIILALVLLLVQPSYAYSSAVTLGSFSNQRQSTSQARLSIAPTQTYHSKDRQSWLERYDYKRLPKGKHECSAIYVKLYWKGRLTTEKEVACVNQNEKVKWLPYGVWYGADSKGFFWVESVPKHLEYKCRQHTRCVYVLGNVAEEALLEGESSIHVANNDPSSCRFEYMAEFVSGKKLYGVFNFEEGGVKFDEPLSSLVMAQGEICI